MIDEPTYAEHATHGEWVSFVFFDSPDQTVDYEIGTDVYYRYDLAGTTYYYRASIFDINVSVYSVKTDGENIHVKNNNEENYEIFTDIMHYWIMPF